MKRWALIFSLLFGCYPGSFKVMKKVKRGIGIVEIKGAISDFRRTVEDILYFQKKSSIKGLIVYIDSPGGMVVPSRQIFEALRVYREKTKNPVIAYLSSVGASGGYYVACGADSIMADPSSITGSIGVIAEFLHFQNLFEKIGISSTTVKTGRFKDIGSSLREMTKEERKLIEGIINDIYEQFIDAVSSSRGMDRQKVIQLADGRIWTGRQAKSLGLVDSLGTFEDAINWAGKLAGFTERPEIIKPPKRLRGLIWDILGLAEFLRKFKISYILE